MVSSAVPILLLCAFWYINPVAHVLASHVGLHHEPLA